MIILNPCYNLIKYFFVKNLIVLNHLEFFFIILTPRLVVSSRLVFSSNPLRPKLLSFKKIHLYVELFLV